MRGIVASTSEWAPSRALNATGASACRRLTCSRSLHVNPQSESRGCVQGKGRLYCARRGWSRPTGPLSSRLSAMTLTRSCRMTWEKGHLLCPRCWSVRLKHGLEGSSVLVPQRNSDNTVTADILLLYTHYYLHTHSHTHTHTHTHTLAHSLSHTYSHTHTQLIRTHTHTADTGVFYQAR